MKRILTACTVMVLAAALLGACASTSPPGATGTLPTSAAESPTQRAAALAQEQPPSDRSAGGAPKAAAASPEGASERPQPPEANAQVQRPALRMEPVVRVSSPTRAVATKYDEARAATLAGRYGRAEQLFRAALAAQPQDAESSNGLGVVLDLQGRNEEALHAFERAVELAPGQAHLHANLGIALLKAQRPADADAAFRRAFRLDPKNALVREHLRQLAQQLHVTSPVAPASAANPSGLQVITSAPGSAAVVPVGPNVYDLQFRSPAAPAAQR